MLIGQTVTIRPGYGYEMLDPIAFRRAGADTSGVVYAVRKGFAYLKLQRTDVAVKVTLDALECPLGDACRERA